MRDRWTGLELRYLVTLAAVGREASFSRAADALGYTQSAVSQQISRLEHITGTRLVERPGGPRPVSLTPAGRLLAGHAEAIGARLASAAADLDALASGTAGLLRVGCYQSVGARLLPLVLREFTTAWPRVEVQLSETQDDGELLADLEGGRLDLTFVVFPLTAGPFEAVELLEDPYVLAVPEDSELARRPSPVSLRHLTGVPLITYAQMREVHSIENRLRPAATAGPDRLQVPRQRHHPGPGGRGRRRRHHLVAVRRPVPPRPAAQAAGQGQPAHRRHRLAPGPVPHPGGGRLRQADPAGRRAGAERGPARARQRLSGRIRSSALAAWTRQVGMVRSRNTSGRNSPSGTSPVSRKRISFWLSSRTMAASTSGTARQAGGPRRLEVPADDAHHLNLTKRADSEHDERRA